MTWRYARGEGGPFLLRFLLCHAWWTERKDGPTWGRIDPQESAILTTEVAKQHKAAPADNVFWTMEGSRRVTVLFFWAYCRLLINWKTFSCKMLKRKLATHSRWGVKALQIQVSQRVNEDWPLKTTLVSVPDSVERAIIMYEVPTYPKIIKIRLPNLSDSSFRRFSSFWL